MLLLQGEDLQPVQKLMQTIQTFFNKVKRLDITSDDRSIDDILDAIDYLLFKKFSFQNILEITLCSASALVYTL